jgi:hypothetical protein
MKTTDFLRQHYACREGAKWALSVSTDMADVWDALIEQGKHAWLIWTATKPEVLSDSVLRKLACRFVRETPLLDGRKVWDLLTDARSKKVVEVAERYEDGKATKKELADAAYFDDTCATDSASFAAYCAAHANAKDTAMHAAYAAAYGSAYTAADAATDAAKSAQVKMMAELGNPFRKDNTK